MTDANENLINEELDASITKDGSSTYPKKDASVFETQKRIAKSQSELDESIKRATVFAEQKNAEMAYRLEYRQKLLEQESKKQLEQSRIEEEGIIQESLLRREEMESERSKNRELLQKKHEEIDELIKSVLTVSEETETENVQSEPLELVEEDNSDPEFLPVILPKAEEKITVEINESRPISVDNILYIPPQSLYVPVSFSVSGPCRATEGTPFVSEARDYDEQARGWNLRRQRLDGAIDEYSRRLLTLDEENKIEYERKMRELQLASEELSREREELIRERERLLNMRGEGGDCPTNYSEPDIDYLGLEYEGEKTYPKPSEMSDDERAIYEYEKYLKKSGVYRETPEPGLDATVPTSDKTEWSDTDFIPYRELMGRVAKLDKQIKKSEKREKKMAGAFARQLYNERMGLERDALELLAYALKRASLLGKRGDRAKTKKAFISRIARYNLLISDFSLRTGMDLPPISTSIVKDIMAGRDYRIIEIYLSGEISAPHLSDFEKISEKSLKKASRDELHRAALAERDKKRLEKTLKKDGFGENAMDSASKAELFELMESISEKTSRDEEMLLARMNYIILYAKTERDINKFGFGTRRKNNDARLSHLTALLNKKKRAKKKALKLEARDNARYFEVLALDTKTAEYKKKRVDRDRLQSVKERLAILLEKRDVINKRLYSLYTGKEEGKKRGTEEKYAKIRRNAAKKSYKQQLKLYKTVEREKIPLDLKEDIYSLMNERVKLNSSIEELNVRIRKTRGSEKKPLKTERKRLLRRLSECTRDVNYYFKRKVKRRIEKRKTHRSQIFYLVLLLVIVAVGFIVYRFFGARILEFLKLAIARIFSQGGGV